MVVVIAMVVVVFIAMIVVVFIAMIVVVIVIIAMVVPAEGCRARFNSVRNDSDERARRRFA